MALFSSLDRKKSSTREEGREGERLAWILAGEWHALLGTDYHRDSDLMKESVQISLSLDDGVVVLLPAIMDQSAGSLPLFGAFCVPSKEHELKILNNIHFKAILVLNNTI